MPKPEAGVTLERAEKQVCRWVGRSTALRHFATYTGQTQSQQHIKPLHWYVACRLVLEGGIHPDDITPHPPFEVVRKKNEYHLLFNPAKATGGERTILGGLKTKNVDVVITKNGIGPVIAVSCKGAIGALRNLTNRMEEAIGDCTNLHITYPAMVCGYLFVMRAHRQGHLVVAIESESEGQKPVIRPLSANDMSMQKDGAPVLSVLRFHSALRELTGRRGIRNDVSRYEAVAFALVESAGTQVGEILPEYPPADSRLRFEQFFETLYRHYDERYVYSAPDLNSITRRLEWSPESPACKRPASPCGLSRPRESEQEATRCPHQYPAASHQRDRPIGKEGAWKLVLIPKIFGLQFPNYFKPLGEFPVSIGPIRYWGRPRSPPISAYASRTLSGRCLLVH